MDEEKIKTFRVLSIDLGLDNLGYCVAHIHWHRDVAPSDGTTTTTVPIRALSQMSFQIQEIKHFPLRKPNQTLSFHESMCRMLDEFQKQWLVVPPSTKTAIPMTTSSSSSSNALPVYKLPEVDWIFLERQPAFNRETTILSYGIYSFCKAIFPPSTTILLVDPSLKRSMWLTMGICLDHKYKDKHERNKQEAIQAGEMILKTCTDEKNVHFFQRIQAQEKQDDEYDSLLQALAEVKRMMTGKRQRSSDETKEKAGSQTKAKAKPKRKRKVVHTLLSL